MATSTALPFAFAFVSFVALTPKALGQIPSPVPMGSFAENQDSQVPAVAEPRTLGSISVAEVAKRERELRPAPWDGVYSETIVTRGTCIKSVIKLNVTDPQTGESWPIQTTLYRPDTTDKTPFSLVIPTIDGVTVLEPRVSTQLCSAKIAGMIAMLHDTSQPTTLPSWGYEDSRNRREILGLRTLLDFAERDARFDKNKLGIMGLSLGGIITSMMAGLEPDRLRSVVIAVGGGDMPYTLAMSDNDQVGLLRQRRMQALGVTDLSVYDQLLVEHLRYDPLYFSGRARTDRIMMIMSTVDTKVPAVVQREQYEAFKHPEYMLFNWGHVETLVEVAYLYMDPVIAFMKSRFDCTATATAVGAIGAAPADPH